MGTDGDGAQAPKQAKLESKADFYKDLLEQADGLMGENRNWVTNTANVSALLFHGLKARGESHCNWCGFYVRDTDDGALTLGPFQGEVACVDIPPGRGVCGAAAAQKRTQLVPNVHEFPGHIACSSATNSEIVVPLVQDDGTAIAVLDLDSTIFSAFDEDDRAGLEALAALVLARCDWPATSRAQYAPRKVRH